MKPEKLENKINKPHIDYLISIEELNKIIKQEIKKRGFIPYKEAFDIKVSFLDRQFHWIDTFNFYINGLRSSMNIVNVIKQASIIDIEFIDAAGLYYRIMIQLNIKNIKNNKDMNIIFVHYSSSKTYTTGNYCLYAFKSEADLKVGDVIKTRAYSSYLHVDHIIPDKDYKYVNVITGELQKTFNSTKLVPIKTLNLQENIENSVECSIV